MKRVHTELGPDGMSSDETEKEGNDLAPKVLRHIPKVGLSTDVSALWRAVEAHEKKTDSSPKRGNHAYQCIHSSQPVAIPPNMACSPVRGLPANYYSEIWWKSLSKAQQAELERKPAKALPSYVPLFSLVITNS